MRNGHAEYPTALDRHSMHRRLAQARAVLSPTGARHDLSDVAPLPPVDIPASVAADAIAEDLDDLRKNFGRIAETLQINEGDTAEVIIDRLRQVIDAQLETSSEGRIRSIKVGTQPGHRRDDGVWIFGKKIVVHEYFGY
jgi:hypothetical protein